MTAALIIEDNEEVRGWLADCVSAAFEGTMITQAASFQEGLAAFEAALNRAVAHGRTTPFDFALVDIGLPDGSGIDLIAAMTVKCPAMMTIVTTVYEDDEHLFDAIEAGAKGYLLKLHDSGKLIELLNRIRDGEPPLSPSIARRILAALQQRAQKQAQSSEIALTPREQEVLGLLGRGFQLSQVASQLSMAQNTASSHVKSIYRKLNISSRAEAAIAAMERGLFSNRN